MKKFVYKGKQDHNSTILVEKAGEAEGQKINVKEDLRLSPGEEIELDETHPVIKSLIDTGLLVESETGKQISTNKNSK